MSNVPTKSTFLRRDYSATNKQKFKNELESQSWSDVTDNFDAQSAYSNFHERFTSLYDRCFPLKLFKPGYKNNKPWLTPSLKCSIKTKNKLFVKMKKHNTDSNIEKYKIYKYKLYGLLRKAERNYYSEIFEEHKTNLKKTWSIIKGIINKNSSRTVSESFTINSKNITNKSIIASSFNKYFANVGQNVYKSIPTSSISPLQYLSNPIVETLFLAPVVENEVESIIKTFKKSACGYDSLCPLIIKSLYKSFLLPLTHVLNLSVTQGIVPNELKIAKIIPLFKNGDSKLLKNYRPISILPAFSKILEKIMYKRTIQFINEHNLLYDNQFGFRSKHSTALALALLTDKISDSFAENKFTVGVFLDFSKAFDTVDHNILLDKLDHYGIRGLANSWFKSYLTNRHQYVSYDNVSSTYEVVTCGVPQGSVLGPLLFLLYINDIALVSEKLFSILFADDSNMFISGKYLEPMIDTLNFELSKIVTWLNANKLSLNVEKSHYIVFARQNVTCHKSIVINNQVVERVLHTKFLGVIIDYKLSWSNHINYIKSKIAKGTGIIYKARKVLNINTLITLYYSFIFPYLTYCIEIWGCTYKTSLQPLHIQQKKILRLITSTSRRKSSQPLFLKFNILNVFQLVYLKVLLFLYKYENNLLPYCFSNMFVRNDSVHSHYTRQVKHFHVPVVNYDICKHFLKYFAVHIYNSTYHLIDYNVKLSTFKAKTKSLILKHNLQFH
jgi:hypothetical protein